MKKIKISFTVASLCALSLTALFVAGCASEAITPATNGASAQTNLVANSTAATIASGLENAGAVVPQPYGTLLTGAGYLIALIAGGIATYQKAQATTHAGAAAALASVVASNPALATQALNNAATPAAMNATAVHLANAASPT
jgi:hypothetical protein